MTENVSYTILIAFGYIKSCYLGQLYVEFADFMGQNRKI